jgi:hypothetical protein
MGSYPRTGAAEWLVQVTLESRDPACLEGALASLLARLPAGAVQKIE